MEWHETVEGRRYRKGFAGDDFSAPGMEGNKRLGRADIDRRGMSKPSGGRGKRTGQNRECDENDQAKRAAKGSHSEGLGAGDQGIQVKLREGFIRLNYGGFDHPGRIIGVPARTPELHCTDQTLLQASESVFDLQCDVFG